jgi:hypothetical protein
MVPSRLSSDRRSQAHAECFHRRRSLVLSGSYSPPEPPLRPAPLDAFVFGDVQHAGIKNSCGIENLSRFVTQRHAYESASCRGWLDARR